MRSLWTGHNWLWTLLFASIAFNLGFGATFGVRTYRHYCCPGGAACAVRQDVMAQLDLSPEQRQSMTAAQDRMLERVEDLRQQLVAERENLADLVTAPTADHGAVAAQLDRIAAIQRQIQECVVAHLLGMKTSLTPDQQAKFNEVIRCHVCPLGGRGPESVPGACERRGECGQRGTCGHLGDGQP
jgi:Spy/CpxP family protein refolding chaperone